MLIFKGFCNIQFLTPHGSITSAARCLKAVIGQVILPGKKQFMSGCNGLNSSYFPFCAMFVIFWWKQGSRYAKKQLRNLAEEDEDNFTARRWIGYKSTLNFLADVTNGNGVKLSVVFIQRIYAYLKDIYRDYKTCKGKHNELCCAGTEIRWVCLFFTVLII